MLIVNGFDRFDRTQNFRYPYAHTGDGLVDRVWPRYNNSFDYVVQVARGDPGRASPACTSPRTSNEAVISGAVNLTDYDTVIWILGEESTADDTFNATEQTKVEQFIAAGGNLFLTGSEIGWDLDQQNNGRTFFENTLKGNYVADDANTYNVTGVAGGIFAGLTASRSTTARSSTTSTSRTCISSAGRRRWRRSTTAAGRRHGRDPVTPGTGGAATSSCSASRSRRSPPPPTAPRSWTACSRSSAPPPPSTPDLVAASDSGADNADNITNLNNAPRQAAGDQRPRHDRRRADRPLRRHDADRVGHRGRQHDRASPSPARSRAACAR